MPSIRLGMAIFLLFPRILFYINILAMMTKAEGDILLIENNVQRRNIINIILRNKSYRVDAATGGFHAFHLLEERKFKVIIIGSNMDDMSALEIMGLIRSKHSSTDLPIIYRPKAISAEEQIEDLKELDLNGVVVGNNMGDLLLHVYRYVPTHD